MTLNFFGQIPPILTAQNREQFVVSPQVTRFLLYFFLSYFVGNEYDSGKTPVASCEGGFKTFPNFIGWYGYEQAQS